MSIQKGEWKKPDEEGLTPDVSLLNETYFNTNDQHIWQITDFLRVKEPDIQVAPADPKVGQVLLDWAYGKLVWYVVVSKNVAQGSNGRENIAVRYADIISGDEWYRVKNGAPDVAKPVFRDAAPRMDLAHDLAAYQGAKVNAPKETRAIPHRRGATRVPPFAQEPEREDAPKPRRINLPGVGETGTYP